MTKNLDQLRQVAANATPGPWRFDTDSEQDYEQGIPYSEWPQTLHGPKNSCPSEWAVRVGATHQVDEINELTWEDVTHIATFDPPTVLALLDRVEAAEAKLERVRAVCESDAFECNTREWGNLESVTTDDVLRALDGGDQT